jgi:hypothetical protein
VKLLRVVLDGADFFVLLASPHAAQSRWVGRELEYWLERKGSERVLIALTGGEIAWSDAHGDFDWERTTALPRALSGALAEEPRYTELRFARRDEYLSLDDPPPSPLAARRRPQRGCHNFDQQAPIANAHDQRHVAGVGARHGERAPALPWRNCHSSTCASPSALVTCSSRRSRSLPARPPRREAREARQQDCATSCVEASANSPNTGQWRAKPSVPPVWRCRESPDTQ